jgi:hypothetical protein
MVININNVKGDVKVSNISQNASISCTNTISMDLSAIDNVRTDLANDVLQQFSNASNTDSLNAAQTSIEKELSASNSAANSLNSSNQVKQTQKADLPMAAPTQIIPPVPGANVNTDQTTVNNSTATTIITAPYTQSNNVNRSIQSSVLNAVTQNFTHETVTQLVTAININQKMGINISNVGGNVDVSNISQNANVVLVSTMNNNMSIGTAIVNSVAQSIGTKTDDVVAIKKSSSTTLSDASTLRSTSSASNTTTSSFSYDQSITQSMIPGLGSFGSCSISSICLIGLIFIGPLLFKALPAPVFTETESSSSSSSDAPTSSSSESAPAASAPESSETEKAVGGYYFY